MADVREASRSLFQEVFNDFWKEVQRELISAHYDAVEKDKTTVFALARSDTRWSAMREKFPHLSAPKHLMRLVKMVAAPSRETRASGAEEVLRWDRPDYVQRTSA